MSIVTLILIIIYLLQDFGRGSSQENFWFSHLPQELLTKIFPRWKIPVLSLSKIHTHTHKNFRRYNIKCILQIQIST